MQLSSKQKVLRYCFASGLGADARKISARGRVVAKPIGTESSIGCPKHPGQGEAELSTEVVSNANAIYIACMQITVTKLLVFSAGKPPLRKL
jgi:hypothetical protein